MQSVKLDAVYDVLFKRYGPQDWWPGDGPFEIMIGAILTQNTAWTNVEKAIANLKHAGMFDASKITGSTISKLARLIRPSGYFNIKAQRLKNFCKWYLSKGGFEALDTLDTDSLRRDLLSVNGIGYETADDILLYAFHRPVFVIDAYTRRLFSRLEIVDGTEHYDKMRVCIEQSLQENQICGNCDRKNNKKSQSLLVGLYNEYHALIVYHGKHICRKRPQCRACCVKTLCPSAAIFLENH